MKIRASQIGKIMTEPRSKSEVLSQTAKTYLQELAIQDKYGIVKEFNNKYMDKGNFCEEDSIQLASSVLELPFLSKNLHHFKNDFITGTPDIVEANFVLDIKTSWSPFTFPYFDNDIPNKDYYYQLQGYMWLCEREHAKLVYCLVDTPKEVDGIGQSYSMIPNEKKVKCFDFAIDWSVIDKIKAKVEVSREYYNEIYELI